MNTEKKSGIFILVVDDEMIVRQSLSNWLMEEGYSVETAENGKDAYIKIKKKNMILCLPILKCLKWMELSYLNLGKSLILNYNLLL